MDADAILESLERAAEACADPAPLVYQRMFETHPHLETLFVMDHDGAVRGNMLETCINIILGLVENSETPRYLIAAARMHHEGYGVPDGEFDVMFVSMRDTFRDLLGADWTPQTDKAWNGLLADISAIA
jgi:hemoglobin-like flavoprotein